GEMISRLPITLRGFERHLCQLKAFRGIGPQAVPSIDDPRTILTLHPHQDIGGFMDFSMVLQRLNGFPWHVDLFKDAGSRHDFALLEKNFRLGVKAALTAGKTSFVSTAIAAGGWS